MRIDSLFFFLLFQIKLMYISVLLQLAQDLISPKDDLGRELKDVKKKSKQKVEESLQQEMEESRVTEVADDGTLPMPEGEEEVKEEAVVTFRESEPGSPKEEEGEESEVKRLRRKKEKVEESMYLIILVVSLSCMSCFLETKKWPVFAIKHLTQEE